MNTDNELELENTFRKIHDKHVEIESTKNYSYDTHVEAMKESYEFGWDKALDIAAGHAKAYISSLFPVGSKNMEQAIEAKILSLKAAK